MPPLASSAASGFLCAVLLALPVLGVTPAAAQEDGLHPLDSALEMLNLKTDHGTMPDFVTQSRGGQTENDYLPVGSKPPARSLAPKTAAEVKSLTAELDAARDAQLAGKRPKPMTNGAPSAKAKISASKPAGAPAELAPGAQQARNR